MPTAAEFQTKQLDTIYYEIEVVQLKRLPSYRI